MAASGEAPDPGTRSELASAVRDAAIGTAAKAAASLAMSIDSFAYLAGMSGLYEIEAAKIAIARSKRDDVRAFAEQMIVDHRDIVRKLGSWAGCGAPTSRRKNWMRFIRF